MNILLSILIGVFVGIWITLTEIKDTLKSFKNTRKEE